MPSENGEETMSTIRDLGPEDEPALQAFLAGQAEGCLHMLSNLDNVGVKPGRETYQGTYAGVFEGERMLGVAAHYWNGVVYIRTPQHCEGVALCAVDASGDPVKGFFGPAEQVRRASAAIGVTDSDFAFYAEPELMTLDLADLREPPGLSSEGVQVRRVRSSEADLMANWFLRFEVEVFGKAETPSLYRESLRKVQRLRHEKRLWGLQREGQLVACCGFSARFGDLVQVGPVWVPPGLRNSGHARTVTAGALLAAKNEGTRRAVLLSDDPAARHAYLALGFAPRDRQALAFVQPDWRRPERLKLTA
jgi:predicted GNAT family N-acyltransferase